MRATKRADLRASLESILPPTLDQAAYELALEALERIERERVAHLPSLSGIDTVDLARALHLAWTRAARRHAPLACVRAVDVPSTDDAHHVRWWSIASGGWIAVEGALDEGRLVELERATKAGALRALLVDVERPHPIDSRAASMIRAIARSHPVATDPGLEHVRRSLTTSARAASCIHLVGEPHTGKAALARWAHGTMDARPLSQIRRDQGDVTPGQWLLFEDIDSLGDEQRVLLRRALEAREARPRFDAPISHSLAARPAHPALTPIIGHSAPLVRTLERVTRLAPSTLPVLLCGEPGVGKELFARAIHELSGRSGPFVAIDAGALTTSLAESTLFGHIKGAFTGAARDRPGAMRSAHGGTLFLDEIGNLSLDLQVKLLRALQERRVLPVGADHPVEVDVRVVAATNADLHDLTRRNLFRLDLLGRLNAATISLPPLRERLDDIDALASHFHELERGAPAPPAWCTPETSRALLEHDWPGNVRELGNVVRYALALCPPGEPVDVDHLGHLSPTHSRPVPLVTTRSAPRDQPLSWPLEPRLEQMMTITTLQIPPLRERPASSKRHAILSELAGNLVTPGALDLLARQPWWGNELELRTRLDTLRAHSDGVIDVALIERLAIPLLPSGSQAPIHVLLSPSLAPNGSLHGLSFSHDAGALLIGRYRRIEELERAAELGDARAASCLERIRELAPGARVECLDLGFGARLSRAHMLLTREEDGLRAHLLTARASRALGGPLGEGLEELSNEAHVSLSDAGEVCILARRSELVELHLFVFLGQELPRRHAELVIEASDRARRDPALTLTRSNVRRPTPPEDNAPGLRVWALKQPEVDWLTDVVMGFEGGQFKRHVLSSLDSARSTELSRLVTYLRRAPRMAQYVVRLYERPENASLRDALAERLSLHASPDDVVALWPKGLRKLAKPTS